MRSNDLHPYGTGDNKREWCIQHFKITDEHISRNHSAVEKHGKSKEKHEEIPSRYIGTGKTVRCGHCHDNIKTGCRYGVKK